MKRIQLIFMGVLAAVTSLHAQQPLTHTQHGQLRTVINPAASLMHMGGEVSVIGRRQRSEEHTSELQSLMRISYAVFCFKKQKSHKNYGMKTHRKKTESRINTTR